MLRKTVVLITLLTSALHAAHPNIILIESDDQRADSIAALGNKAIKSPGLDRLATGGTAFTNFRNQGSNNGAVCVCSRSMLQSGQSLWRSDDALKDRVTLGELLQSAGYHTYGTGKWHNGNASLKRSFAAADHITPGFLAKGHDSGFSTVSIRNGVITNGKNVPPAHSSDVIGKAAVDFLKGYDRKKPFFLYVGFNAPHDPYTPVPEWEKPYRDEKGVSKVPAPPAFLPSPPFDPGVMGIRDEVLLPRPLEPARLAAQNANYYGMITQVDHWVGRILDELKAGGLEGETIVIFTSDHGLGRGSNGLLGKQNLYDHSLKVPFLAKGPGIRLGGRSDTPLYLFQIYRTIADYAGVQAPEQSEGASFRPLLEGASPPASDTASYHGYTSLMRAVVSGSWKLVEYQVAGTRHTQFFDLKNDPNEEHDLSKDAAQAERITTLRKAMMAEREKFADRDQKFWSAMEFASK